VILIIDRMTERTCKNVDEALEELRGRAGRSWKTGATRSSFEELSELDRFAPWDYRSRG